MSRMRWLLAIVGLLAACWLTGANTARADPFYLRYDANEFPEEAGWERRGNDPHGQLIRTVESGIFMIDSRASFEITDWYYRQIDALALDPGEELRFEWRMWTLETSSNWMNSDVNLTISNSAQQYVMIDLAPEYVAVNEDGVEWPEHVYWFEAEGWHTFLFASADMEEYDLFVDGTLAFHGRFTRYLIAGPHFIAFGDTWYGLRSLSQWDYLEIEVVPEPAGAATALVGIVALSLAHRRTAE